MRTRAGTTTRAVGIAAIGALLVIAAGCGGDDDASSTTTTTAVDLAGKTFKDETSSAEVEVDAVDNTFQAPYITVKAGTKVTFRNDGHNEHDVEPVVSGAFPSISVADFQPKSPGTEVTFGKAGDYPYYCTLHGTKTKGMVGAVRVVP